MATKAYVGLGANLGDAKATLERAIRALEDVPGYAVRGVSKLYATKPVGVADQPEFRNAVVALDVPSGPDPQTGALALLVTLKQLEESFGRKPRRRWGPRELDLDLLAFGRAEISVERPKAGRSKTKPARLLVVPHPEAAKRLFVLAPWSDIAGSFAPPGWGETIETARRRRAPLQSEDAVREVGEWEPESRRWAKTPQASPSPTSKRRTRDAMA